MSEITIKHDGGMISFVNAHDIDCIRVEGDVVWINAFLKHPHGMEFKITCDSPEDALGRFEQLKFNIELAKCSNKTLVDKLKWRIEELQTQAANFDELLYEQNSTA